MNTTTIYSDDILTITRIQPETELSTSLSDDPTTSPIYQIEKQTDFQFSLSTNDIKHIQHELDTDSPIFSDVTQTYCPVCSNHIVSESDTLTLTENHQIKLHPQCNTILNTTIDLITKHDPSTLYAHYI